MTEAAHQSTEIARLKAEIAELREKLGRNSHNSSLPPSSDSPFGKPAAKREPSGCRAGAQAGHTGFGRKLKPIAEVDRVVDLRPFACSSCGSLLLGVDESPARRQIVEITDAGTLLTEYRRHYLRCLCCQKLNRAEWSEQAQGGALQRLEFQKLIAPVKAKASELLFAGTQSTNSKTRNTCSGILKLEVSLWTFSQIEGVEPTNNQAERALRRAVIWRRKSFGTQSETGSRFVERILTVVTTLRQQGRSVFEYLCKVCLKPQPVQSTIELALT